MAADDLLKRVLDGDTGPYVELIQAQALKLVRGSLPHPEGRSWDRESDVDELLADYFESPAYEQALIAAVDDDQFAGYVFESLRNLVRARLRRTERGRLLVRLKDVMRKAAYVQEPSQFWRRSGDPEEASSTPASVMVEAAWSVDDVRLVRWRPDSQRNSPVAEGSSFLAVLDAVLDAAGGAVHQGVLLDVVAARFGIGPAPVLESLDVPEDLEVADTADDGPETAVLDADGELGAADQAAQIWGQLSPREKQLFPRLAETARAVADATGQGKTPVNDAQRRLKAKLRLLVDDLAEERRLAVTAALLDLAADS